MSSSEMVGFFCEVKREDENEDLDITTVGTEMVQMTTPICGAHIVCIYTTLL